MEKKCGSWIRDKHPGSATLIGDMYCGQVRLSHVVEQVLPVRLHGHRIRLLQPHQPGDRRHRTLIIPSGPVALV
jgi:hypothetical protein